MGELLGHKITEELLSQVQSANSIEELHALLRNN